MNTDISLSDRMERAETYTMSLFIDDQRQITSVDRHGISSVRSLRNYLRRVVSLSYKPIRFTFAELYYATNFKRDEQISRDRGGDWYSATVVFRQNFTGWNGPEATFNGSEEKVMTVLIQKNSAIDGVPPVDAYLTFLGDCKLAEIESTKR